MSETSLPLIADCDVTSTKNKDIYDAWATNYEKDVREWGYSLPEKVAEALKGYIQTLAQNTATDNSNDDDDDDDNDNDDSTIRILDAGAGNGLSGLALRNAVAATATGTGSCCKCHLSGNDISPAMLAIAESRNCYDALATVDLNTNANNTNNDNNNKDADNYAPLPYATNQFDMVTCTGTLTYIDPNESNLLREFARIVRSGGIVCYTNRTDKLERWKNAESELLVSEEEGSSGSGSSSGGSSGVWRREESIGPIPYLPGNAEYGKEIEVVIFIYRVL